MFASVAGGVGGNLDLCCSLNVLCSSYERAGFTAQSRVALWFFCVLRMRGWSLKLRFVLLSGSFAFFV